MKTEREIRGAGTTQRSYPEAEWRKWRADFNLGPSGHFSSRLLTPSSINIFNESIEGYTQSSQFINRVGGGIGRRGSSPSRRLTRSRTRRIEVSSERLHQRNAVRSIGRWRRNRRMPMLKWNEPGKERSTNITHLSCERVKKANGNSDCEINLLVPFLDANDIGYSSIYFSLTPLSSLIKSVGSIEGSNRCQRRPLPFLSNPTLLITTQT